MMFSWCWLAGAFWIITGSGQIYSVGSIPGYIEVDIGTYHRRTIFGFGVKCTGFSGFFLLYEKIILLG